MEKDALLKQLDRTNKLLSKQNSAKYQFYLSIIRGIGIAIGITIIGGIVTGILNNVIQSAYDIPIMGKILQELLFQQTFSQ